MSKWLKEPFVHFLLLGALLFGLHALLKQRSPEPASGQRIEITRGDIDQLRETWRLQWQRPPTAEELRGLIETQIREEVFYREALALGLERNDTIVRRRLAQKFEFLTQDVAALRQPTRDELAAYYAQNAERYRVPTRTSFVQIYFKAGRNDAERAAQDMLARLRAGKSGKPAVELGDPSLLEFEQSARRDEDIRQMFGQEFAEAVLKLAPGTWQGPLRSAYGWHLVRVAERSEPQLPVLAAVEERVRRDWLDEHRRKTQEDAFKRLRARYEIVVAEDPAR